jgi:glycosyltransferase involved in cell wall biosynthesis
MERRTVSLFGPATPVVRNKTRSSQHVTARLAQRATDTRTAEKPANNRLRILHVTATTTGGVGLLILSLVKHLDRRAFKLSVAFGRGYLLDRSFDEAGVTVYTLSTSRRVGLLAVIRGTLEVYRILSRGRYDIVQSHTSVGGVIGRLAGWAARTPVVLWTVHGLGAHPGHPAWKRLLLRSVESVLDWFTNHYVAVSNDLRDAGVRAGIYPADKVSVIPNGLQLDHVPSSMDRAAKRRALGIPEGCPVIGTVTRLEPQKANDVFLQAVAGVTRHMPDLVTLIAGDGPQRADLEGMAASLGLTERVRFLGWRTDAVELLGILDIFCMSSRWEGCPMVLLEAMAMRCPIVATDIGGVREIVINEETGLLVALDDPEALANAVLHLLGDDAKRERFGEAGRRRVKERFSAEGMLDAYGRLYRNLAPARRS